MVREPAQLQRSADAETAPLPALGASPTSLRTTLLLVVSLVVAACSEPSEQVVEAPTTYDLVIVPTEEFPRAEATKVATIVASDTGLRIKTVLPLGTRDWKPYPDRPQFDPNALKTLALPAIERLKTNYGGKVYVILTSRDIGPTRQKPQFRFHPA